MTNPVKEKITIQETLMSGVSSVQKTELSSGIDEATKHKPISNAETNSKDDAEALGVNSLSKEEAAHEINAAKTSDDAEKGSSVVADQKHISAEERASSVENKASAEPDQTKFILIEEPPQNTDESNVVDQITSNSITEEGNGTIDSNGLVDAQVYDETANHESSENQLVATDSDESAKLKIHTDEIVFSNETTDSAFSSVVETAEINDETERIDTFSCKKQEDVTFNEESPQFAEENNLAIVEESTLNALLPFNDEQKETTSIDSVIETYSDINDSTEVAAPVSDAQSSETGKDEVIETEVLKEIASDEDEPAGSEIAEDRESETLTNENRFVDHNDPKNQVTDLNDDSRLFEKKDPAVPCVSSIILDRLHSLKQSCYKNWPLRRLLAFGALQEEINNLITDSVDTFVGLEQMNEQNIAVAPENYEWIERLDDQAWKNAFEMCEAWQQLLQEHSTASFIEHYRISGIPEKSILAKVKCSSAEAQQLCKCFCEAILQWLNHWHAVLDFLYNHSILQVEKAEYFFGKVTFAIIRSVAEEAPNYGCVWLVYKELPFIIWNPTMKMNKYSLAVLAEDTFKQLKTTQNYKELTEWFEKELNKKTPGLPAETLLNLLLETKGISPNDAIFKKGASFHNVIKGDHTRETDSTHTSMADDWSKLSKWLIQQFNLQPMLGAIDLYDDEYAVLMADFPKRIQYLRSSDNPERTDPLVCIELVQFAIRESKSGALWTVLGKLLCCKNTDPVMQWLGNLFIRTLTKYHKAVYEAGEKVASVLMHCFVCNAHISDFFDFLYAYYRLDLIRDTDQMDVAALCERMVSSERYSYSSLILQQTLDAMRYMPEISIARFEKYISWIDHAFWNIDWKPEEKGRFALAFEDWRSKHPDFNGSLRRHMSAAAKGKRYFSKPYLELDLRNGNFWLILPVQKLRFGMEDGACWKVKTDIQQTIQCELIEAVTCYHTEEIRIPLNESALLHEMTFELFANGKTKHMWTIESDCYRAFDENGQLITGTHLATGTVYMFTEPNAKIQTKAACTQQMHGSWLLSVYDFSEGEVIGFPDDTVTVVGAAQEEGLCGSLPVAGVSISLADGQKLAVYAEKPLLLLQTSAERFSTGRLLLNGAYLELAGLEHQSYVLKNRTDEFCWLITLPETENGVYKMQADIAGEKDQRIWQFAVVPDLVYSFEGEVPYWNQTVGKMKLACGISFNAPNLKFDETEGCYCFDLSASHQEIEIILASGLHLSIRIPMICWRVPQGKWSILSPGDLWHTEFPEKIEFLSSSKQLTLSVDDEAGTDKQHSVFCTAMHGGEIICCDTLPLRSWFNRNRIRHSIYLTVNDTRRVFAQVYRMTLLEYATFEPDFENNVVKGFFDLSGKGLCVVSVSQNGNSIVQQTPIVKGKAEIPMAPEPGTYQASIYEVETDEFGFDETLYSIGEYQFKIKDPGNITGMTGYLKEIEPTEEHPEPLIFPHKYYWLDILQRDPNNPNRYAAQLREDDDFAKMFGKYHPIPIYVYLPNRTNIRRIRITYPMAPIPRAFMFEPKSHRLVKREKAGPNAIKLDSLDVFHIKFVEKV